MHKNVLITGATGLVGTRLTEMLMQKGYQVSHLSRNEQPGPIPTFQWDVKTGKIDDKAIEGKDCIVHLAGAGIADKSWTDQRKKEILESRTKSAELLYQSLKTKNHQVKTFVSASAIGIYGFAGDEKYFKESDAAANDFLANVVSQWEAAVDKIASLGIRVVKVRIGILLSEKGGALAEMIKPIKWGIGSPLGTGMQYMSWIHIDDVCSLFAMAIEKESMSGAYNAVSPHPATNKAFTKAVAQVLNKPLWLPNVPGFVLKLLLGEMSDLVLKGSRVSAEKIQGAGFEFEYAELDAALKDLLKK